MPVQFFEFEQNSPEWFEARRGIPTASNFQCLMAKSAERKGRATYMRQLAAEIITGEAGESFKSAAMDRGHALEDDAANYYSMVRKAAVRKIGFARNDGKHGAAGASPDRLIGDDGNLEIKTQRADILIETLAKDEFPNEHVAQVQGGLWVTDREFADLIIYWPKMPALIKRVRRDVRYIAELAGEVARFNDDLAALVEKIRAYGMAV
jgi:hypothetical protein